MTDTCSNLDKPQKHVEQNKPDPKGCESMFIFYSFIYMVFKSRHKLSMPIESRTMVACVDWEWGKGVGRIH